MSLLELGLSYIENKGFAQYKLRKKTHKNIVYNEYWIHLSSNWFEDGFQMKRKLHCKLDTSLGQMSLPRNAFLTLYLISLFSALKFFMNVSKSSMYSIASWILKSARSRLEITSRSKKWKLICQSRRRNTSFQKSLRTNSSKSCCSVYNVEPKDVPISSDSRFHVSLPHRCSLWFSHVVRLQIYVRPW